MKIIAATALAVLTALPMAAQPNCASEADVTEILQVKFKEAPVFLGMTQDGSTILRAWLNPETGTWTITGTDAHGTTCVLVEGQAGQAIAYAAPPEGDPA